MNLPELEREEDSHKGEHGRVAVIGGSKDYTGAPALSAEASLRTGCDLVKILAPEASRDVIASFSENLIVDSYRGNYFSGSSLEKAYDLVSWSDAAVIGPGLGDAEADAVRDFLDQVETPVVVDAEAIKPALDAELSGVVFTPHRGEADLIEEEFGSVENFVEENDVAVVVKGVEDKVYTSEGFEEFEAGTPAMTVGGTGDTLTGIIASLISQGAPVKKAALKGVQINGRAGELATEEYGNGMLATDLVERIPYVFH